MSSTVSADKNDAEYLEHIDTDSTLSLSVEKLAALFREHRGSIVCFTGAGISTSAGIPDFRSGLGSATGMPAGKWCKDATASQWSAGEQRAEQAAAQRTTSCLNAVPTPSHMSLVKLAEEGYLAGLISQNCDGLHRRSGFPPSRLAELHGNTNLEYCAWCGQEYFRDFRASTGRRTMGVRLKKELWATRDAHNPDLINPRKGNHYTGRRCQKDGCDGYLFDSTIDFGDNLPATHIKRGYDLAANATLCLVLGSRCAVSPACDMPISVGKGGGELVVVNLQRTAADAHSTLRIGAKIDDVLVPLMEALGLAIPTFKLQRHVWVERGAAGDGKAGKAGVTAGGSVDDTVSVRCVDEGLPHDALWNVQALYRITEPTGQAAAQQRETKEGTEGEEGKEGKEDAMDGEEGKEDAMEGKEADGAPLLQHGRSLHSTPDVHPFTVRLNQDTRVNADGPRRRSQKTHSYPKPGDTCDVEIMPWHNVDYPGLSSVRKPKKYAWHLSPDVCDVLDHIRPVAVGSGRSGSSGGGVGGVGVGGSGSGGGGSGGSGEGVKTTAVWVVDAGEKHGPFMQHRLPAPTDAGVGATWAGQALKALTQSSTKTVDSGIHCDALTLMFRAHYGEVPVQLPFPAPDTRTLYHLQYDPMAREWLPAEVVEHEGRKASGSDGGGSKAKKGSKKKKSGKDKTPADVAVPGVAGGAAGDGTKDGNCLIM